MNDRDHLPVDVLRARTPGEVLRARTPGEVLIYWPLGLIFFLIALVALLAS